LRGLVAVPEGGFSFLPGGLPYSQGVRANAGYAIEHVQFAESTPVFEGFERIESYLKSRSRPLSALCAVELRSPQPLSLDGFKDFNRGYAEVLTRWGLVQDGINAVARSNVAPVHRPPPGPSLHAFSFAVPCASAATGFVVAGSSEWPEGGRFPEDVVCYGDTSPPALRKKARYVLQAMERRMASLGVGWAEAFTIHMYSAHDHFDFYQEELALLDARHRGVTWHYCRPPVVGWEFEMDVKRVKVSHIFDSY
jgi:hypothetical protein